nr:hypothetical protein [Tanacetum cinerariifolium]
EILRLKERVQVLEDRDSVAAKHSGDGAPIKGRSITEGEAAAERISNDSEEKMFMFKPFKSNIISLTGRFTQKDRRVTRRSSG